MGTEDTEMDETSPCPHSILSPARSGAHRHAGSSLCTPDPAIPCAVGGQARKPSPLLGAMDSKEHGIGALGMCGVMTRKGGFQGQLKQREKHKQRRREMRAYSLYQAFLNSWWLISVNLSGPEKHLIKQLFILIANCLK